MGTGAADQTHASSIAKNESGMAWISRSQPKHRLAFVLPGHGLQAWDAVRHRTPLPAVRGLPISGVRNLSYQPVFPGELFGTQFAPCSVSDLAHRMIGV